MPNQYILILVWVGIMAIVQRNFYREEYVEASGLYEWRVKPFFAFVVMLPVIWTVANRGWIGDTGAYVRTFLDMPDTWAGIADYAKTLTKDPGYYVFAAMLKQIIGSDSFKYLLVMASIQGVILLFIYRKYSWNYVLSIFLFLASTDYISWMCNGVRQFTAVVICLAGTPLLLKKKYIPYLLIVAFASLFHQSAFILIPIVIIAQGEAWNKKTLMFLVLVILAVSFVGRFTGLLDDALSTTQYVNVVSDYTLAGDDGTNPIRVLIYSLPAIFAFWKRKTIQIENNPLVNFCVNMSIVTMGLYVVSMVTSGIFLGRLPIYCSLYGYILLPWEMNFLFNASMKRMMTFCMVLGYLLFYYYQMHIIYGMF